MKNKSKKTALKSDNNAKSAATTKPEGIWGDSRFAHLVNDPRFKYLPQSQKKIKIDKRFESMFSDDKFKVKYSVDKYGRKQTAASSSEDLKKYYDLKEDSTESEDDEVPDETEAPTDAVNKQDEFGNDALESDEDIPDDIKSKIHDKEIDYARGMAVMTDSSDDEESDDDEDDELFIEHVWGELDRDAPRTEDSTYRLAVCNMDWDRIRAIDIMVLCSSFLPTGGVIRSVIIYPSEFGMERMIEEEQKGPQELREYRELQDAEFTGPQDEEEEEGNDYHMEKLRQYQLNRLKYYYAVIVCDSVATADKLYEECDGLEYESTATKFDLRFIPDEVSFDDDTPKDECTELPDMATYKPRLFTTTALQQAKVELTWDENDIERKELNEKLISGKINEVTDVEMKKYVAYSSEDESNAEDDDNGGKIGGDDDSDDSISKYKSLLLDIKKKDDDKKMSKIERQLTWGIGGVDPKSDVHAAKKVVELTPFEKIVEKKIAKQKARKEERNKKLGKTTGEDSESEDDLPADIDMSDPYFAEEFKNGEFAPSKKSTSAIKGSSDEDDSDDVDNNSDEEKRKEAELALLLDDDEDVGKSHFSLKKIIDTENETKSAKKRRRKHVKKSRAEIEASKKEVADNFTINTEDSRFSAVYTSHLYNIDPTDPHFKKTKAMDSIINEKLKRRRDDREAVDVVSQEDSEERKKRKKDVAVSMLVKSIKRKVGGATN